MSGDTLYWALRRALDVTVWGGELIADVKLPTGGPAVFVANHAGALGPIGIAAALPVRLYPWIIGDMVDRDKAGAYLHQDFVGPELHLPDGLARPVAVALSRVTVSLLRNLGCIPVWHDRDLLETYRTSEAHLELGHFLLVFPEDPKESVNRWTGLRPFRTGFAHLGNLYHEHTKRNLNFYPVAVHSAVRRVQVGAPIVYNPLNAPAAERRRLTHAMETMIAAMLAGGGEPIGAGVSQTP